MKKALLAALLVVGGLSLTASATEEEKGLSLPTQFDVLMHGGGCRKSSPPGMCCHKNHSTGIVHCH
mgnify:CR=1 FL=1